MLEVYLREAARESMLAFWHGQKRYQFDQDDAELSDLGRRGIHAAIVRTSGALCMEELLAGLVATHWAAPSRQPRAYPEPVEGRPYQAFGAKLPRGKSVAPLLGPRFKEAKLVGVS